MDEAVLRDAALEYHRLPESGKIAVTPTKGLTNQHDLSLAYSPGVAYACLAIRAGNGISVGPIPLGTAKPVHILEPAVSVRRIVNMTALAVVDASVQR